MPYAAFLTILILCFASSCIAQEIVNYPSTGKAGALEMSAMLTLASGASAASRAPAVVLLHSGGGWMSPVTGQYAKALSAAGFVVLEPRLFAGPPEPEDRIAMLPQVYGALAYLASRQDVDPERIGVAGFSYGGQLTLHAAASWAQAAFAAAPTQKFAAHAPFYPVCWAYSAFAQGKRKTPGLPSDAFTRWTGAKVRIFAGSDDDFDDRDPGACADFVSRLPAEQQAYFSVQVYPGATHGWDQRADQFFAKGACKGKGCLNHNYPNPRVTTQSIADLVTFFSAAMK